MDTGVTGYRGKSGDRNPAVGENPVTGIRRPIKKLQRENRLDDIVDGNMKTYDVKEVGTVIQVALLCTQSSPEDRPTMAEVVRLLQGVDLAERWAEWEQLEDVRSREFSLVSHQFAWAEESTHDQVAIQLSEAR
ncbi:hypothetical protein ACLB2K_004410 [Fragaria x ananassa]